VRFLLRKKSLYLFEVHSAVIEPRLDAAALIRTLSIPSVLCAFLFSLRFLHCLCASCITLLLPLLLFFHFACQLFSIVSCYRLLLLHLFLRFHITYHLGNFPFDPSTPCVFSVVLLFPLFSYFLLVCASFHFSVRSVYLLLLLLPLLPALARWCFYHFLPVRYCLLVVVLLRLTFAHSVLRLCAECHPSLSHQQILLQLQTCPSLFPSPSQCQAIHQKLLHADLIEQRKEHVDSFIYTTASTSSDFGKAQITGTS